jgi:hypothetical protein
LPSKCKVLSSNPSEREERRGEGKEGEERGRKERRGEEKRGEERSKKKEDWVNASVQDRGSCKSRRGCLL